MGKEGTGGPFSQGEGGGGKSSGGGGMGRGGSGAPHRKITPQPAPAMQIHREQSARPGARPQGGLGQDAGAAPPGGVGGADPKGTPNTRACPSLPAVLLAAACRGLPPAEHPSFTLWEGAVF